LFEYEGWIKELDYDHNMKYKCDEVMRPPIGIRKWKYADPFLLELTRRLLSTKRISGRESYNQHP
jgi:hypothetical protein